MSAVVIDKIGIVPAIQKALNSSLRSLAPKAQSLVLLDGGLKAPFEYKNKNNY